MSARHLNSQDRVRENFVELAVGAFNSRRQFLPFVAPPEAPGAWERERESGAHGGHLFLRGPLGPSRSWPEPLTASIRRSVTPSSTPVTWSSCP